MTPLQGDRRSGKQALVQLRHRVRPLIIGNEDGDQLLQKTGQGQHQQRTQDIEYRVGHGDAQARGGLVQNDRPQQRL